MRTPRPVGLQGILAKPELNATRTRQIGGLREPLGYKANLSVASDKRVELVFTVPTLLVELKVMKIHIAIKSRPPRKTMGVQL